MISMFLGPSHRTDPADPTHDTPGRLSASLAFTCEITHDCEWQ